MKKLSFKKLMAMAIAVCMILSCVTAMPAFAETNGLYDVDFDKLRIIGITGTDGKTSTATMIKNIINIHINT